MRLNFNCELLWEVNGQTSFVFESSIKWNPSYDIVNIWMNGSFLIENVKLDLHKTMDSNFTYANLALGKQCPIKINRHNCFQA